MRRHVPSTRFVLLGTAAVLALAAAGVAAALLASAGGSSEASQVLSSLPTRWPGDTLPVFVVNGHAISAWVVNSTLAGATSSAPRGTAVPNRSQVIASLVDQELVFEDATAHGYATSAAQAQAAIANVRATTPASTQQVILQAAERSGFTGTTLDQY